MGLAIFTVGFVVSAQAQQEAQTPVLQANAQEVSINLLVHDKKDELVTDLEPRDVVVTDDGSPVALTSLHLVKADPTSARLITLLFEPDLPEMKSRAREVAAKVVKMTADGGYSLAVLQVGTRLRLQQAFTSDHQALEAAIHAITDQKPGDPFALPEKELIEMAQTGAAASGKTVSDADRARAQTLLTALQASGRMVEDQHVDPGLAGLFALVQSEQAIPQRKGIVYFTRGRPFDSHAQEMLETLVAAANRASVSIYVIDLNALDRSVSQGVSQNISSIGMIPGTVQGATGMQSLPPPSQVFTANTGSIVTSAAPAIDPSPFENLAKGTGGSYVSNETNPRKPLERMLEDITSYYQASYIPSNHEYDGKFRPIGVKPMRAGLSVRASTGYFAMPLDAGGGMRPFELSLLRILAEPKLATDLELRTTIVRTEGKRDAGVLLIEAPLVNVEMQQDANTRLYSEHLSILVQIKDKTGAVVDHFSDDTPRRGALEQIAQARLERATWQYPLHVPSGHYVAETAILDRISGKSGAQRLEFDVPAEGPATSPVVLPREEELTSLPATSLARPYGSLAVTLPASPAKAPAAQDLMSILADATTRALAYSVMLPNFLCIEVTRRSTQTNGKLKHQGSMSELLTYRDNAENRTMMEMEVYGKTIRGAREDLEGWLSDGEFGSVLKSVFGPASKTAFAWNQTANLAQGTVQIFDYRVAREQSKMNIRFGMQQATVGFHGQVFVETATRNVRRITLVADALPPAFPIHGATMSIDYDYVAIHNHDYLLPVDGQLSLERHRNDMVVNDIEFRNYRRFGSSTRLMDYSPVETH